MKTVVQVSTKDRKGNPATQFVQILSDTTFTDDYENPMGEVVYSFSTARSTKNKTGATSGRCRPTAIALTDRLDADPLD
jgi:hypothetical protein